MLSFSQQQDEMGNMDSQEHNMVVLGQIFKHIPAKLIEKLKGKYKIQTRSFSETSHVAAMIFVQLSHALSLNDICDCLKFHKGYLIQIRDCTPPSRNGLAYANAKRDAALAEELFWEVFSDIKKKYPEFISGSRHYPGMPWRFKRAIHVVDSTTIQLIAKCMNWAKHEYRCELPTACSFSGCEPWRSAEDETDNSAMELLETRSFWLPSSQCDYR